MANLRKNLGLFIWAGLSILGGAVLISFHQPFRQANAQAITRLVGDSRAKWRMIHVLSGSCSCSQRVMRGILSRQTKPLADDVVLVVDDGTSYLQESESLLSLISTRGIIVRHIAAGQMEAATGLAGVPMLVVSQPDGVIRYAGGYGDGPHQDLHILAQLQQGSAIAQRQVIGCAIGARLKRRLDPFHMKYDTAVQRRTDKE